MKRIVSLFLMLLLFCCLLLPVAAEDDDLFDRSYTRFNDYADTVTEDEEALLNDRIRGQIDALQMDFPACVFLKRQSTSTLEAFAADFYERNRFGCGEDKSGILLVLDLQNAKFGIYYYGEADTLIGEEARDALSDAFKTNCRNEELTYYQAFDRYYDDVFAMVEDARAHPQTTRSSGQSGMPDWYPENTEGFQDFHGENLPPVVDDAHIFTDEQFETLSDRIRSINERFGISYAAFTSDDNHGLKPEEYSSDFLHFNGYGEGDGYGAVVFYLSLDPEDRCWLTTSINTYESLFTFDVTYEIDETVDSSIRGGEYYEAFLLHAEYVEKMFAAMCEDLPAWYPAGTRTFALERDGRTYASEANADAPRITDDAGAISAEQLESCSETLRALSQQYGLDLVIFIDESTRAPRPAQYADDFYYYNGYGADGICMYLLRDDGQYGVRYYGRGTQFEKLSITQRLSGSMAPDKAIEKYTKLLTFMLRHDRLPMQIATALFCLAVGVVAGLIVASLLVDRMKQDMRITRTVCAVSYLVDGSLRVFGVSHNFLYSDVTRRAKPKDTDSSGSSSSSSSRGGSTYTSGHSAGGSYSSGGRRF